MYQFENQVQKATGEPNVRVATSEKEVIKES